jgi:peptide/nickel transport system substrate-binding protein
LPTFAAMRGGAIVKNESGEKSNLQTTAIGTGPFKLVEYVQQDRLRFQKNPSYWDKGKPYLDEMVMKVMTEEDARVAALRAGQVDLAVLSADGADKVKADRNVSVLQSPKAWLTVIMFNAGKDPVKDARVRRALALALDHKEVISKAVSSAAVLSGPVPTGHTDWFIAPEKLPYTQVKIDEAKKLLGEAGFPNGFKLQLKTSPLYPEFVSMALVAQENWKKIGVETEVVQLEWGTMVKQVNAPNYEYEAYTTARTFYPDPDQYLYPYFHPKGASNPGPYSNDKVNEILDRARSTMDPKKRHDDYFAVQDLLLQDSPHLWVYSGLNIEAARNSVKGYVQSFTGRRIFLNQTWVDK